MQGIRGIGDFMVERDMNGHMNSNITYCTEWKFNFNFILLYRMKTQFTNND